MIKINLLGDEETTSADSIIWLVAFVGSMVITVVFWFAVRTLLVGSIQDYAQRIATAEATLIELRDKTKEVDELKKKKDELQSMTLAIAYLRKAQEGPVRLLDSLSIAVPENLWLLSVDTKNDTMKIEGLSLDDPSISELIKNFRTSEYVLSAELKDRRAVGLVQVNTFNSFTGEQTKSVVRADRSAVQAKFNEVKKEAESQGLAYTNSMPDSALKDSVERSQDPSGGVTKLSFDSTKKRFIGGRPTIFAWESLEEVKGLSFSAEAKIRYSAVKVDLESLLTAATQKEQVPESKAKKKKASDEE